MMQSELRDEIFTLFHSDPDDHPVPREFAHANVRKVFECEFDFLGKFDWEGSSGHPSSRCNRNGDPLVTALIRTQSVPINLLVSALRLYADSLIEYSVSEISETEYRYYPATILTAWSAFESLIRHSSELFLATSKSIPSEIRDYLVEQQPQLDKKGNVVRITRFQSPLDRYRVLLKYGFDFQVDKGSKHWQNLESARKLRDNFTHLDAKTSRSIAGLQVLSFIEHILLGIIWPSTVTSRSIGIGFHNLYWMWDGLRQLTAKYLPLDHTEQPFFHNWPLEDKSLQFYCPFEKVDISNFPNWDDE